MATFSQQISDGANDGFTNAVSLFASNEEITMGNVFGAYKGYMRFTNVTIANGSTVSACDLDVISKQVSTGTDWDVNIGFSDEDDASFPSDHADAESRTFTTAVTNWIDNSTWGAGDAQTSPDFAASAEELFGRGGWSSGNAALVMVRDNGSSMSGKYFAAVEDATYDPVTLNITYTAPAPTGTPMRSYIVSAREHDYAAVLTEAD